MNCLQFFIFTRFFAVVGDPIYVLSELWIAYNFLSLQGSLQFCCEYLKEYVCCELLTIFYLYKKGQFNIKFPFVVNCLQFFIFTRFFAVYAKNGKTFWMLWIAYNFLSLQGSLQSWGCIEVQLISCELLTIFYLYKVLCSFKPSYATNPRVVNCLQFFIFTRFFAVLIKTDCPAICCELLTIFYLYKVLCSFYFVAFSYI